MIIHKKLIPLVLFFLFSSVLPAVAGKTLTGIALDVLDMDLEAFHNVSEPTIASLSENAFGQFENVYAIIDADHPGMVDFSNPNALTDLVDEMYEHDLIKPRLGLASSLSGIVEVVDVGRAALAMAKLSGELAAVAKDLPQAAQELSALIKGHKKAKIIKNALLFGSGRRANSLQTMLDQINEAEFGHIWKITNIINDTYFSGKHKTAAKAFESVLYVLQKEVADEQAENLRNRVWAKITLQDFIVKKWVEENIINDATYNDFNNLNFYSKDKDYSLLWSTPVVRKLSIAGQYYDLITDDDFSAPQEPLYDFETEIHNTSLNMHNIQIPETVLDDAEFGQPQSITFLYDGSDIFPSYPDAISNRTNIAGTQIPKSFTLNLSAYPALKSLGAFNVTVDYGNDNRKYAADYLGFSPEITSVAVLSSPDQWTSEDFSLDVEVCGDESSRVYVFYKKAENSGFPLYDYLPFDLTDPINVDGDCRTYSVTVDGWELMYLLGGNRDVTLLVRAYGTSVADSDRLSEEVTKYLVNLNDIDNDNLPDSWEERFFGDRFAYSAADDPDGDGADNLFEYRHNTDPTKPGVEGIIESKIFKPVQDSSGDWQYDFALSGMYWANVVQKEEVTLTIYENEIVVQGGFSLESGTLDLNGRTLVIMGDFVHSGGTLNVNGGNLFVKGELRCSSGTVNLNSGEVSIESSFLHSGGTLNVNGGKLIVKGDYRIQGENTDGSYTYSYGYLNMVNEADHIVVEGNFFMDSDYSHDGYLTAGILELKGNFTQKSTSVSISNHPQYNFSASGTHKVLLSGNGPQEVSFDTLKNGSSHFNILEISNPDLTQITFTPCWPALVYSEGGPPLVDVTIGTVDFVLSRDMTITSSGGNALRLDGYSANLDLNGHTLTVEGDFLHSSGILNVNGGKLIVKGDYRIQGENTDGSYTYSYGYLNMVNEADHIVVEGNFFMDSDYSHDGYLTAGILELKGNFTQKSTSVSISNHPQYNFSASGTHKVLLSGNGPQEVSFDTLKNGSSHFNILEISNPDLTQITFTPCWPALVYSEGGPPLVDVTIGTVDFVLSRDMTVAPSEGAALRLYGAKLDLNGHTLTVEGDLLQSGGTLNVNGGKLIVRGDYRIQTKEGENYTYSGGMLKMENEADHILVENDFFMDGLSHEGYLTAGILEVRGDFIQKSTFDDVLEEYKNFQASGTHKVLLSGTGPQTVTFEDAFNGGSHFNILEITTNTLKTFATKVAVTKLFNHQRNPFTLTNEAQSSFVDYDSDGIKDHLDSYPLDPTNQGTSDRDNDGVPDDEDAFPDDSTESVDTDSDGIGNNTDTDDDNDGITDTKDAFPLDAAEWSDIDNDGQGDNADIDDDNDNVIDEEDNCPLIANPDQEDENGYQDGDDIGDACEEQPKKSMMCFPVKAQNGNTAIICL